MNSGLYALAGASATATAAAWANRLLEPMTKVSKMYFGLSRAGSLERPAWPWRPVPAYGLALLGQSWLEIDHVGRGVVDRFVRGVLAGFAGGVVRQRQSTVTATRISRPSCWDRAVAMHRPQPGLEDVLGEVVGRGQQRGVLDQRQRAGQLDPGSVLRGEVLVGEGSDRSSPDLRQRCLRTGRVEPAVVFELVGHSKPSGAPTRTVVGASSTRSSTGCACRLCMPT